MKRVQDDRKPTDAPNLRDAFAPIPPDVRERLVRTARSVTENEQATGGKHRLRPALVAAILVCATMSAALAVHRSVGWNDFFSQYHGSSVPAPMQEMMDDVAHTAIGVGPITFTVEQALCDGQTAILAISARTTDGSPALLAPYGEGNMPIPSKLDTELSRLGLAEGTTWREAARLKGLPLYEVYVHLKNDVLGSTISYSDYLHGAEGEYVSFSGFSVDAEAIGDAVPVDFLLLVSELNPDTGKVTREWQDRLAYAVRVNRDILGEKTYVPEEPLEVAGLRLESIRMELRVTGAYVYTTLTAADAVDRENGTWLDDCYNIELVDQNGNFFSEGVSMSGGCDDSGWPVIVRSETVMIDELPDVIGVKLSYDDPTVHLLK